MHARNIAYITPFLLKTSSNWDFFGAKTSFCFGLKLVLLLVFVIFFPPFSDYIGYQF
jgi:hypothetical protein